MALKIITCPWCGREARITYEENRVYQMKCYSCQNTMLHEDRSFDRAVEFFEHHADLLQAEKDGRKRRQLYRCALDTWGPDAQTLMVMEEMSELQKELCKHARGKDNLEAIVEEIADVQIMLEQMMVLYDCNRGVKDYKEIKVARLASRLSIACEEAEAALAEKGGEE